LALPHIKKRKRIPYELFKGIERATYSMLMLSYLFGSLHVQERYEAKSLLNLSDEIVPEDAINMLKERIALPPEEFYKLDRKARFRAFTVALLTGLDAIERVKEKLTKALEKGKTLKEFIEELGQEEVLQKAGFSKTNPWYWETVFRTNLHSAYNAGKMEQVKRLGKKVKYLKFVAIDDNRTTEICRSLNGTVRPASEWNGRIPPLHFNCRSTLVPIFEGEKVKPTKMPSVKPQGGFGQPLDSWWIPTESMSRRIAEYGYTDTVLEKAKKLLCPKEFSEGCGEFEKIRKSLKVWEEQKRIEKEFLRKLEELEWDTKEKALESFKRLWVDEKTYRDHVITRVKYKQISNELDYILRTFKALMETTEVLIMKPKSRGSWTRVYYLENLSWCVIVGRGGIITSFKIEKEWFRDRLKFYKEKLGYEPYKGAPSEELKRRAKRIYDVCKRFRERS